MAATAGDDAAAAEVVEQTVTEETARSSSEEFQTSATAAPAATAAPTESRKEGLDTLGKIALFGLGALAVGQILKNGSEVVSNSGDRVVVQQPDGSYKVYKNDDVLMFQPGTDVKTYAYDDGSTRTVATRDDGTQIETIRAADGTVLRRTRILANGDRVVLFDDTQVAQRVEVNKLPQVDRADRAINFQQAKEEELRAALQARLPQEIDRRFSLSQVRNITAVRNLVPEIDVDNINFETGSAIIRPEEAEELAELGFGHADLIIAVPQLWVDVETLDDLDEAAAVFRRRHGFRLRIATKYHRLIRDFMKSHGVADYQLVDSQGATEGTVKNETAEAVADITSTGETLRANHLKILGDGLVLKSQATLFRSRNAPMGEEDRAAMAQLIRRLDLD